MFGEWRNKRTEIHFKFGMVTKEKKYLLQWDKTGGDDVGV